MTTENQSEFHTALVTGAASGIGRGIAERFAAEGIHVVCADKNGTGAESVAGGLKEAGHRALALEVDVTSEASVAVMTERAVEWTGRIDTVIANAGIMIEGDILSLGLDDWNRAMAVNATGAFLTARAVLPHFLSQGGGTLVFTASTVGLVGMKGTAAYSASKGAVVALTRQLAADYAESGVRANAIAPGAVRTPLSESQFRARTSDEDELEEMLDKVIERYPINRWGTTADIAEVALFLAFEKSAWITGQIIPVDGGLLEVR